MNVKHLNILIVKSGLFFNFNIVQFSLYNGEEKKSTSTPPTFVWTTTDIEFLLLFFE